MTRFPLFPVLFVVTVCGCSEQVEIVDSTAAGTSSYDDGQTLSNAAGQKPTAKNLDRTHTDGTTNSVNWPRFRGPDGRGVSTVKGLPVTWSDDKNVKWKMELPGPGLSSPVVWGNHVYVTCFTGFDWPKSHAGKKPNGTFKRHLICFDLLTGRKLWQRSDTAENFDRKLKLSDGYWQVRDHGFASNTPTCDKHGVYAYFAADGLFAFTHEGKPRWSVSCGTGAGRSGSASSPVSDGERIYLSAHEESAQFFAIDARNGKVLWKLRRHGSYGTPLIRRGTTGTRVVLRSFDGDLKELDGKTGKELWSSSKPKTPGKVSLIEVDGRIISVDHAGKIAARHRTGKVHWELNGGPYFGTPVYDKGRMYSARGGVLTCIDAKEGKVLKRTRLPGKGHWYASPVIAEGRVYCVSREGGTCVVSADAECKLLAHNRFAKDDSYFNATPAITTAGILLRSNRYLYCVAKK